MLSDQLLIAWLPLDTQKAFRKLSTINQLRFILIWIINGLCLLCFPIVIWLNLRIGNTAFATINIAYLLVASLPTLYACYQLRIKFALYYSLFTFYIGILAYYTASILRGFDTHCELLFIAHAAFSIIFLKKKQSVRVFLFLLANFIGLRYYIESLDVKPQQQGFLVNSLSIFIALFVLIYYVKILAIKNSYHQTRERQLLRRNYQRLTEINQLKDKTFGMIGHDLRSPIAVLKTQLMLLRNSIDNNKELTQHSQDLSTLVDTIQVLLDNIYHWSMLQQDALVSRKVNVDLADIADEALQTYVHLSANKRLKLETSFKSAFTTGDEYQLLVLARNLIQNAIKFTPNSGIVRVETGVANDKVFLLVKDTGIGFPEPVSNDCNVHVLQRSGTMGEKGSGMGLSIIRGLTKLNGGFVHYESIPGQGTKARIIFNKSLTQLSDKRYSRKLAGDE